MAALQVRNMPDDLYKKLVLMAKKDHRSIAQETIVVLSAALNNPAHTKERRQALMKKWKIKPNTSHYEDPVTLIRADRDR